MDDHLIPLMSHSYYLKNWMFRQPVERSWVDRTFSKLDAGCLRAAIVTLCSSTIGAGALALPYAVSKCGIALGAVLMILVSASFIGYYRVLVRVSMGFQNHSYLQLVEAYFGKGWKVTIEIFVAISCMAVISSLQAILCEVALSILPVLLDPKSRAARTLLLGVVNIAVLFPLCRHPQLTTLRYVSIVPLVSVTGVLLMSMIHIQLIPWGELLWYKLDSGVLEAVCIMFFSFDAAINIPAIHNELKKPSFKRMEKVVLRSLLLITTLYLLVGSFGFATNTDHVPSIIVLQGEYSWSLCVAQLLVVLNMVVEIPLSVHPLRLCMEQIFLQEDGSLYLPADIITMMVLFLPMTVAIFVPNITLYFEVLGAIFSVTTGFIIPSTPHSVLLFWKFSNSYIKKVALLLWTLVLATVGVGCLAVIAGFNFELLESAR